MARQAAEPLEQGEDAVLLSQDEAEELARLLYGLSDACEGMHALWMGALAACACWAPRELI
jgi:hypothetical protein